MQVYLVRHAHAGTRSNDGRDIYRQLSPDGHVRAAELVEVFAQQSIGRLLSSPATRCAQTLSPLGSARGLEVEESPALWEGSSIDEALGVIEPDGADSVVACSHGDIIPGLIEILAERGVQVSGRGCELGSIWVLEFGEGEWRGARYVSSRDQTLV